MLKIKALTSIFSFDYEHMSVALRLTSGCGRDYVSVLLICRKLF